MADLLGSPVVRLIFWSAVLLVLLIVAVYVLRVAAAMRSSRDSTEEYETNSSLLAKFRELRSQGELSESEFRTIRTNLAERFRTELKREDDSS
jgi:uncharacterized membrane protein